jgi:hypothetical protein
MACLILANGIFLIITHRIYDMGHSNTPAFNWQLIHYRIFIWHASPHTLVHTYTSIANQLIKLPEELYHENS